MLVYAVLCCIVLFLQIAAQKQLTDSLNYTLTNSTKFATPEADNRSDLSDIVPDLLIDATQPDMFTENATYNSQQQEEEKMQNVAGGFYASPCPNRYVALNGLCWIAGSSYWLQLQNKYMEDYHEQSVKASQAHRVVIQARTGQNKLTGDIPVKNISILVWHNGPNDLQIIDYSFNKAIPRKRHWKANSIINMTSNPQGKVLFSVIQSSKKNDDDSLNIPLIKVHASFMPEHEAVAFPANTAALDKLSRLDPQQLHQYVIKNFNNSQSNSINDTKVVTDTLRQMILPLLHAEVEPVNQTFSRIEKRSLQKPSRDCKVPYIAIPNLVRGDKVHKRHAHKIKLNMEPSQQHFEVHFGQSFHLVKHTPQTMALRKRQLIISQPQHPHEPQALIKRSFFSHLWDKIKRAAKSVFTVVKDVFVDLPKSFFNVTAWREGKKPFLDSLKVGVSNATKDTLIASRDIIAVVPFGDRLNDKLGINDLVGKVQNSTGLIVTPLTFGFDLIILGPKEAVQILVTEMKTLGKVIAGICKKLGLFLKDVFKFVLAIFNWNDILMNHRVLTAHFQKMPQFIKSTITEHKGNFSSDLSQVISRVSDTAVQASSLFASGQFNSFSSLVTSSNKEIYKNLTENASVQQSIGAGGPADIQGSFVSDHLVNSNGLQASASQVQPTDEQRANLFDITKDAFTQLGTLVKTDATGIQQQFQQLGSLLKSGEWNMTSLFSSFNSILSASVQVLLKKAVDVVLYYYDVLLSILDGLLRIHIKIPFITAFYEKIITRGKGTLTLYDLFSLAAAIPVTVGFKIFNNGSNLFTEQEVQVITATAIPDDYVDNLVQFAMQYPNRNATKVREMYRVSVSYILGAGFSAGSLLSAAVGYLTDSAGVLFFLRIPFEYLLLMCKFPWTWYTDSKTTVGVNVRFIGWLTQFIGFLLGWFVSWPSGLQGFSFFRFFIVLLMAVPNIILIIEILIKDIAALTNKVDAPQVPGFSQVDVMLKCFARLMTTVPTLFIAIPWFRANLWTYVSLESLVMFGAQVHVARLYVDMPLQAVYSV